MLFQRPRDLLCSCAASLLRGLQPRLCRCCVSPHWAPPDNIVHKLRSEVPLWVMGSVFAFVALLAFLGLRSQLHRGTDADLDRYTDVVKLAPQPAYVTITLP